MRFWESEREQNYKHWQAEVVDFRNRIQRLLKRSPSLKKYMHEIYAEVYRDTVDSRKIEFDIPENNFIELEQMLRKDYFG